MLYQLSYVRASAKPTTRPTPESPFESTPSPARSSVDHARVAPRDEALRGRTDGSNDWWDARRHGQTLPAGGAGEERGLPDVGGQCRPARRLERDRLPVDHRGATPAPRRWRDHARPESAFSSEALHPRKLACVALDPFQRSALSAFPSDCASSSTGRCRSPRRATRRCTSAMVNFLVSIGCSISSQLTGVATSAPGRGRTE
jgi:hypothetical protein